MTVIIKLNGIDVTNDIDRASFSLVKKINYKVDTVSFNFLKTDKKNYTPKDEDFIEVLNSGVLEFSGIIDTVEGSLVNKKTAIFKITAVDTTKLLSRKLVTRVYNDPNMTISEMVTDIITTELVDLGVTAGVIDTIDKKLGKVVLDYKKASDVLTDLADYSLCYWKITPDKKLHFLQRGSESAPLMLLDGNDSYLDSSVKITKSTRQIRNVIYVTGGDYVGEETTDVVGTGNGEQKTFRLPYVYDVLPTVYVNNVAQTVGVAYINSTGYQCYWDRNGKNIIFDVAVGNTLKVKITGLPVIPLMTRLNAGGAKKYEFRIIDKTLNSKEAVKQRAKAEIDAYAKEITSGSFQTYNIGVNAGEKIVMNSPLLGVNDEFIITEVVLHFVGEKLKNTVKIASKGEYDIIDLFRYLLRKGEKEFGIFRDTSTILLDYIGVVEKIIAQENYNIRFFDIKGKEDLTISDVISMLEDFSHIWVVGDYSPINLADPKRTPIINSGAIL